MKEPLTPDEDRVFREFIRLDVEPNQIPVELYQGFMERLAGTLGLPLLRVRAATQGLIDKGVFDTDTGEIVEKTTGSREILRDLLLHDPEVQEMLQKMVAEICSQGK